MKPFLQKTLLSATLCLVMMSARGQWVTIPDTNFVNWLNTHGYSGCMNGNQMDTTCITVLNTLSLYCNSSNIHDLTGITYFDSLKILVCTSNQLTSLPALPASLNNLYCYDNQLSSLPILPDSLKVLFCYSNLLTSLPALPSTLILLQCNDNQLTSLPLLPDSLWELRCNENLLTALPALPTLLNTLDCSYNQSSSLPALPASLAYLNCGNNLISSLPFLPASLVSLDCNDNFLSSIPALPSSLYHINCSDNPLNTLPALPSSISFLKCFNDQLTFLPTLPAALIFLYCNGNSLTSLPSLPPLLADIHCYNNQLSSLPVLPASLTDLYCYNNQLTSLPVLPPILRFFWCYNNQISSLPVLPPSLQYLYCYNNQLTSLPVLPHSLKQLWCSGNLLTALPALPDTLSQFRIENNPMLQCMPPLLHYTGLSLPYYFDISNTGIICLPNVIQHSGSFPAIDTMPVCDIFNANGCEVAWNIEGNLSSDVDNNCATTLDGIGLPMTKVNLYDVGNNLLQQMIANWVGKYSFEAQPGNYFVSVDTANFPFDVLCPLNNNISINLTAVDSMDYNVDFRLVCKPGFDVGVKSVSATSGRFRPGNYTTISALAGDLSNPYNMHCASSINGNVTVTINGPASFSSVAQGALTPLVIGNMLIYPNASFSAFDFQNDFKFIVQTAITAQAGDQICFDVSVTPLAGDNNIANNNYSQCFTVRNSYDPNEKEVYPSGIIDTSQHNLTYTIYFQNTGNDTALHVYILDTLDSDIDASSIQLLTYSHEPLVQVMGNVVKFNFPNINLMDSVADEPNSHGYVQYGVRLQDGLLPGTVINNTANIVFDFNAPLVTNTTFNQIDVFTSLTPGPTVLREVVCNIYPNPLVSGGELKIVFNAGLEKKSEFSVYDMSGRKIFAKEILSSVQTQSILLPLLSAGMYECEVSYDSGMIYKKLVVTGKQ